MPGYRELCRDVYHWVMGAMAHPLRGIIVEPIDDGQWQSGVRQVTISVTPSGASYPRTYTNVPYSGIGDSSDFKSPPNSGDYVDVVFKGSSSEFPTIVGRHAGTATSQAAARALSSRAMAPSQTIGLGVLSSMTMPSVFSFSFNAPATDVFGSPVLNQFTLAPPPKTTAAAPSPLETNLIGSTPLSFGL